MPATLLKSGQVVTGGGSAPGRRATFRVNAIMGEAEIIVGDDVSVDVGGLAVMGGFDGPSDPTVPGARVTLHVTGTVLMGGVTVRRAGPGRRAGR